MKFTGRQREILIRLIRGEKERCKNPGFKLNSDYKKELDELENKFVENAVSFENQMRTSMEAHSAREDW